MTPVDQTRFAERQGDCLSACVATILGMSIKDVPLFCTEDEDHQWYPVFAAWLNGRGIAPLSLSFEDEQSVAQHMEWARICGMKVPWIAGGPTTRGRHYVVYLGKHLFHDPNPHYQRAGLQIIQDATFLLRQSF